MKLTKKDLPVFEVAIVGPAEVSDELVEQINQNTDDIGDNEDDIATNTTGVATNVVDIAGNVAGVARNVTGIADNAADILALGAGGSAGPSTSYFRAAACEGNTSTLLWNSNTSVTAQCASTLLGGIQKGSARFTPGSGGEMTQTLVWDGNPVEMAVFWLYRNPFATVGPVRWVVDSKCLGGGETSSGFGCETVLTPNPVNATLNVTGPFSIDTDPCAVGDLLTVRITRDVSDSAIPEDTLAADVDVFGARFTSQPW